MLLPLEDTEKKMEKNKSPELRYECWRMSLETLSSVWAHVLSPSFSSSLLQLRNPQAAFECSQLTKALQSRAHSNLHQQMAIMVDKLF